MVILGIDASIRIASMAVSDTEKGGVLSEIRAPGDISTCEAMIPMMKKVLADAGKGTDEIDAVAVTAGPGSFTGLRIACSFAQGLAYSSGRKCFSLPTLDVVPYGTETASGSCTVLMDAKGGSLYAGKYNISDGNVTAIKEIRCMTAEEFIKNENEPTDMCLTLDEGVIRLLPDELKERLAPKPDPVINGSGITLAARLCKAVGARYTLSDAKAPNELLPRYYRLSTPELAAKPKL